LPRRRKIRAPAGRTPETFADIVARAGRTPEMFAEYREIDPVAPGGKAIERRIALAWLALSNARRDREWVRAAELEFGLIPRLESELADLRKSAN
jgi:hypothetical protein